MSDTMQIVGKTYRVEYVKPSEMQEDVVRGWADPENCLIKINESLSPQVMEETRIHEWIEAHKSELRLKLSHRAIYCLAGALYGAGFRV